MENSQDNYYFFFFIVTFVHINLNPILNYYIIRYNNMKLNFFDIKSKIHKMFCKMLLLKTNFLSYHI